MAAFIKFDGIDGEVDDSHSDVPPVQDIQVTKDQDLDGADGVELVVKVLDGTGGTFSGAMTNVDLAVRVLDTTTEEVTEHESNLTYSGESGGINESTLNGHNTGALRNVSNAPDADHSGGMLVVMGDASVRTVAPATDAHGVTEDGPSLVYSGESGGMDPPPTGHYTQLVWPDSNAAAEAGSDPIGPFFAYDASFRGGVDVPASGTTDHHWRESSFGSELMGALGDTAPDGFALEPDAAPSGGRLFLATNVGVYVSTSDAESGGSWTEHGTILAGNPPDAEHKIGPFMGVFVGSSGGGTKPVDHAEDAPQGTGSVSYVAREKPLDPAAEPSGLHITATHYDEPAAALPTDQFSLNFAEIELDNAVGHGGGGQGKATFMDVSFSTSVAKSAESLGDITAENGNGTLPEVHSVSLQVRYDPTLLDVSPGASQGGSGYEGQIEISSFSWGVSNMGSGAGDGSVRTVDTSAANVGDTVTFTVTLSNAGLEQDYGFVGGVDVPTASGGYDGLGRLTTTYISDRAAFGYDANFLGGVDVPTGASQGGHIGQLEVHSWNFGVENPPPAASETSNVLGGVAIAVGDIDGSSGSSVPITGRITGVTVDPSDSAPVVGGAGLDVLIAEIGERDSFAFDDGTSASSLGGQTIRMHFRIGTDGAVGGAGNDLLVGGAGDDLLIGGDTSFDVLNGNLQIADLTSVAVDPSGVEASPTVPTGSVTFVDHHGWTVF